MLTIAGELSITQGGQSLWLYPSGRKLSLEIPSWRAGLKLMWLAWRHRTLRRQISELLDIWGISLVARYRNKVIFRSNPNQRPEKLKEDSMSEKRSDTRNWPELAEGLYEKLTGRGAEIHYRFDELEVAVPSGTGNSAEHANWKLNGAIRIRTQDLKS